MVQQTMVHQVIDRDKQMDDTEKWEHHYQNCSVSMDIPTESLVLRQYQHLLPSKGVALDLACGNAGNAFFLAQHGFEAHAWDISPSAIVQVSELAQTHSLPICALVRDVENNPPQNAQFDVVVVSRFLHRSLFPALIASLKPAGVLFYQTFTVEKPAGVGPRNPYYLLAQNELLALCSSMTVRAYHDEGKLGDSSRGFRNEAMIVAQKI